MTSTKQDIRQFYTRQWGFTIVTVETHLFALTCPLLIDILRFFLDEWLTSEVNNFLQDISI